MSKEYFKPKVGSEYENTRLLILSESTYDWIDADGINQTPQSTHPADSVEWNISNFGQNRFFTYMSRALCADRDPTESQRRKAWEQYAHTVFVQKSVGFGPGVRPTEKHWNDAHAPFLSLLEDLKPRKVVVVGKTMWQKMPNCRVRILNNLQAYELKNKDLVWCLALPHPANRTQRHNWERAGESISYFKATNFPENQPN